MACGTCAQTCDCLVVEGAGASVSGVGSTNDPYVVELAVATDDTESISLAGDGGSTPLSADLLISGDDGNAAEIRSDGLYVEAISSVSVGGTPLTPDGSGGVDITLEFVQDLLADSFSFATYSDGDDEFDFTPSGVDNQVWTTVSGVAQWADANIAVGDQTWASLTLDGDVDNEGSGDYNDAEYSRLGSLVFLRGCVKAASGTPTLPQVIGTLAMGYRPAKKCAFIQPNDDFDNMAGGTGVVVVADDGLITLMAGSVGLDDTEMFLWLDGITFDVG